MSPMYGLIDPPKQTPDQEPSLDQRDYKTQRDDYQYELTTKVYHPEDEIQPEEEV